MRGLAVAAVAMVVLGACSKKAREGGGTVPEAVRPDAGATVVTPAPSPDAAVTKVAAHEPEEHRAAGQLCGVEKGNSNKAWEGCKSDKECQKQAKPGQLNGRCMVYSSPHGPGMQRNECQFDGCMQDADCQAGPCLCDGRGNYCSPGNCKVDADCGAGGFCSASGDAGGYASCGGTAGFYCHTAKDDCIDNSDCKPATGVNPRGPGGVGENCVFSPPAGKWTCVANLVCPVG
jgi:hypothetical protein